MVLRGRAATWEGEEIDQDVVVVVVVAAGLEVCRDSKER
jgi:hypothetical protein